MTLRLAGSSSGFVEIDSPAVGGNNTLVLPTGNGSANQALVTDGSGSLSWSDRGRMTLGTAQNSTSGTSIDFTGIPSWVKRVTVMFNGVSTNGTAYPRIQLGVGSSPTTSGYSTQSSSLGASSIATINSGSGFDLYSAGAIYTLYGLIQFATVSSNIWLGSGVLSYTNITGTMTIAGYVPLSGALGMVRLTTSNGTDTFDAGSINILYEG